MMLAGLGTLTGLIAVAAILVLAPRGGHPEQFLLPAPLAAPDFTLTAHTGRPFHMREETGDGLAVIYFGYTNCPDICPVTLTDLGHARAALGKDAERVKILFVTVDPARDTPTQLADYVKHFPAGITGLTGTDDAVQKVASGYLAFSMPAGTDASMPGMGPMPGDSAHGPAAASGQFEHTARSFVVKGNKVLMTFPAETPASDMASGLRYLLKG